MAEVNCTLSFEMRPSYWALLDTAHEITATHGEDAAIAWAHRTLERDFDLFVETKTEIAKPKLRVIEGGR